MTATLAPPPSRPVGLRRDISLDLRAVMTAGRVKTAVVATENPTEVYDWRSGQIVLEQLLLDGCEVGQKVCLLLDHKCSIPALVGSAAIFRRREMELLADLQFARGTAASDEAWELVSQGHARALSVGYRILDSTMIAAGRSKTIGSRTITAPADQSLRVVTRWRIKEVSLVPIGADEAAGIRSAPSLHGGSRMPVAAIGRMAEHMSFAEFFSADLSRRNQRIPENSRDIVRAGLSSVEGVAALEGLVNVAILEGFRSTPDSLAGVYQFVPLSNYLVGELASIATAARVARVPRGKTAEVLHCGLSSQGWALARYGAQVVLDEQDLIDGARIGVRMVALRELGRAARRVLPDLLWSLLLANANLDDGSPIFTGTNLGTAALANVALGSALAAVAGTTTTDTEQNVVHLNQAASYLIVPPELFATAKGLVHALDTTEGNLIVRSESRMGDAGLTDPATGAVRSGLTTNWLLACSGDQSDGLAVGTLDGRVEPSVRSWTLDQGQWGVGFDVELSVAVAVLSRQPLYWSTGSA